MRSKGFIISVLCLCHEGWCAFSFGALYDGIDLSWEFETYDGKRSIVMISSYTLEEEIAIVNSRWEEFEWSMYPGMHPHGKEELISELVRIRTHFGSSGIYDKGDPPKLLVTFDFWSPTVYVTTDSNYAVFPGDWAWGSYMEGSTIATFISLLDTKKIGQATIRDISPPWFVQAIAGWEWPEVASTSFDVKQGLYTVKTDQKQTIVFRASDAAIVSNDTVWYRNATSLRRIVIVMFVIVSMTCFIYQMLARKRRKTLTVKVTPNTP